MLNEHVQYPENNTSDLQSISHMPENASLVQDKKVLFNQGIPTPSFGPGVLFKFISQLHINVGYFLGGKYINFGVH